MAIMTRPDTLAPHSVEAEEAVLGSILIYPECLTDIRPILLPDHFYILRNGWIYEAILDLYRHALAIDNLTVIDQLKAQGRLATIGGSAYITSLINHTPTHIHAETYARIVQRAAIRRQLLAAATQTAQLAVDEDAEVQTILDQVRGVYRPLFQAAAPTNVLPGRLILDDIWRNHEYQLANPSEVRGLKSGIAQLDRSLSGFRPGLYAIGGAASMGKSTFAGGLVWAFASQAPGVYVPTEVRGEKALAKIICDRAGLPYKRWLAGNLREDDNDRFTAMYGQFGEFRDNITVLDGRPDIDTIEATLEQHAAKWLIIDSGTAMSYQNLSHAKGMGLKREGDLRMATTTLCQRLQDIGHQLPVVALWQTGRNAKDRANKEPGINDFKESGAVEETADVCMALYRHPYYVARGLAQPDSVRYPPNTALLLLLKDRDGGTGEERITLGFHMGHGFMAVIAKEYQ